MKFFNSAIFRLTLWYVAVLGLFLMLFASATYLFFGYVLTQQTDRSMTEITNAFEKVVREEIVDKEEVDEKRVYQTAFKEAAVDVDFQDYRIFVFTRDKELVVETRAGTGEASATAVAAQKWLGQIGDTKVTGFQELSENAQTFRVMHRRFKHNGSSFHVLTVHNLADRTGTLMRLRNGLFIGVPLALLLASIGGFFLARKSFAPIARMTEKAEEISAKSLHQRLPVQNSEDELGRLATAFNDLLGRLNSAFKQQHQFMADASHELRTPVAIVRGEAEVSLSKEERSASEYRETLGIVEKEGIKMSGIIEDLFMLARADAGENPVNKKPVYLEDILENVVKSFRTLAAKNEIKISLRSESEMEINADEYLLLRLFTNLIDNAVKHARTTIRVAASLENGKYVVRVYDDGKGITKKHQPKIFDRFYRSDQARSRKLKSDAGSGAGLGLPISRWIAEAHDGALVLKKSDSDGSEFEVMLPSAGN